MPSDHGPIVALSRLVDNQEQIWDQGLQIGGFLAVAADPFLGRVNPSRPVPRSDAGFHTLVNMPSLIDDPLEAAT